VSGSASVGVGKQRRPSVRVIAAYWRLRRENGAADPLSGAGAKEPGRKLPANGVGGGRVATRSPLLTFHSDNRGARIWSCANIATIQVCRRTPHVNGYSVPNAVRVESTGPDLERNGPA
jgi:hypothetical protein